jgi:hypothetical protein
MNIYPKNLKLNSQLVKTLLPEPLGYYYKYTSKGVLCVVVPCECFFLHFVNIEFLTKVNPIC